MTGFHARRPSRPTTVNTETVTSQLLYEIGGPEYLGPDVTTRFDTIDLTQIGPDRVRISGTRGQAPPQTLKVAMNQLGGYRNSVALALTGLDIEEKARFAQAAFWDACPYEPDDFRSIVSRVIPTDKPNPGTQEEAAAIWRLTVKDPDERKVGRAFSNAMTHTGLSSIPGLYGLGGGPSAGSVFGVYRPATVPAELVPQYVHVDGATVEVESVNPSGPALVVETSPTPPPPDGPTEEAPIGRVAGTRSGDKGGDANLGIYARTDAGWAWLDNAMTVERLRDLLPEMAELDIERYRYPAVGSLNFVVRGLLEEGVAASTRQDAQAKALGEWLRAKIVAIPTSVLEAPIAR